jgi:TolB protein
MRPVIATDNADVCPHFTVDSQTMMYATKPEDADQLDIYAHDVDNPDTTTASDTRLTNDPAKDDYGEPGPDGRIVFVTDRDGNPELYIMNADGSGQQRLTTTPGISENLPDW